MNGANEASGAGAAGGAPRAATPSATPSVPERVSVGIAGLDDVLGGGLPPNRLYLVQGDPGVGKTTLGLQFLLTGAARGERVLYVTLSETREEIEDVIRSHGWEASAGGVAIHEHTPGEQLRETAGTSIFHPAEVELGETVRGLLDAVERVRPSRVVFDSLSEMRLLASDTLRYRREILSLKQYFSGRACTVLLLDDGTTDAGDRQLQSLCHGVVQLGVEVPDYGAERRRLRVAKLRGVRFRGGYHDYAIRTGGLEVYPRLVAAEHRTGFLAGQFASGVAGLDEMLGGGVDRGTNVAFLGPSGTGKSTLATRFLLSAAERGETSAAFVFEETLAILLERSRGLGMDLQPHLDAGRIRLHTVDPAELSPNEFVHRVRDAVETYGARLVLIDSLNGFLKSMPGESHLLLQLHELLTYLSQRGVTAFFTAVQHGLLMGSATAASGPDVSDLADTVVLLRYFEHAGSVRRAISVLKRRSGDHERTIRELLFGGTEGIGISGPLSHFHGLLTGMPVRSGDDGAHPEDAEEDAGGPGDGGRARRVA